MWYGLGEINVLKSVNKQFFGQKVESGQKLLPPFRKIKPLYENTCNSETDHFDKYFIKQVFYNFLYSIKGIFCKMFKICFLF